MIRSTISVHRTGADLVGTLYVFNYIVSDQTNTLDFHHFLNVDISIYMAASNTNRNNRIKLLDLLLLILPRANSQMLLEVNPMLSVNVK